VIERRDATTRSLYLRAGAAIV